MWTVWSRQKKNKTKNAHEKYENHTPSNSNQRQPLKLRRGNYQTEFIHFVWANTQANAKIKVFATNSIHSFFVLSQSAFRTTKTTNALHTLWFCLHNNEKKLNFFLANIMNIQNKIFNRGRIQSEKNFYKIIFFSLLLFSYYFAVCCPSLFFSCDTKGKINLPILISILCALNFAQLFVPIFFFYLLYSSMIYTHSINKFKKIRIENIYTVLTLQWLSHRFVFILFSCYIFFV